MDGNVGHETEKRNRETGRSWEWGCGKKAHQLLRSLDNPEYRIPPWFLTLRSLIQLLFLLFIFFSHEIPSPKLYSEHVHNKSLCVTKKKNLCLYSHTTSDTKCVGLLHQPVLQLSGCRLGVLQSNSDINCPELEQTPRAKRSVPQDCSPLQTLITSSGPQVTDLAQIESSYNFFLRFDNLL